MILGGNEINYYYWTELKYLSLNRWFPGIQSRVRIIKNLYVVKVERKLRDISKKEAGKGVILKHLNMATRWLMYLLIFYWFVMDQGKMDRMQSWRGLPSQCRALTVFTNHYNWTLLYNSRKSINRLFSKYQLCTVG